MYVLGLNCYMHDAAAALLKDGEIVAFVEEERFSRRKHTTEFPHHAIRYCLDAAGISKEEVDDVAFFWVPWKGLMRRGIVSLAGFPSSYDPNTNRYRILRDVLGVKRYVQETLGFPGRFHWVDHHQAHMASTFFLSPFEESAIWIADGSGEEATTTYAVGQGTRIRKLKEVLYPHSLGHLYLCVTEYLGFREQSGEGKVMGLAPYGDPAEFRDAFAEIVRPTEDGRFEMDMSHFDVHLGKKNYVTEKFIRRFGPRRARESAMERRFENVAAALQERTEEIALHALRRLREESGSPNLCLAGGVALNSCMNGKILASGLFDEIFIQPAANDAGTSLGAALWVHHVFRKRPRGEPLRHIYYGPEFTDAEMGAAAAAAGLPYERLDDPAARAAELLAEGKILGWFQGRMEFGPRALGNRSLLADPRRPDMKDVMNARVKRREGFRPFAPSVLAEKCGEWFAHDYPSPYMLMVYPIRPEKLPLVPAVAHVDGTGRVQTVTRDSNPLYYRLIEEFERLTGVPMVLNTSFNVRGEPIVRSPEDAIACFKNTDFDCLILGRHLLRKGAAA